MTTGTPVHPLNQTGTRLTRPAGHLAQPRTVPAPAPTPASRKAGASARRHCRRQVPVAGGRRRCSSRPA